MADENLTDSTETAWQAGFDAGSGETARLERERDQARAERDEANAQAARLAGLPSVVLARPWTPAEKNGSTTTYKIRRSCNGCGASVGDVTLDEIDAAIDGLRPADVRQDCVFCLRAELAKARDELHQIRTAPPSPAWAKRAQALAEVAELRQALERVERDLAGAIRADDLGNEVNEVLDHVRSAHGDVAAALANTDPKRADL